MAAERRKIGSGRIDPDDRDFFVAVLPRDTLIGLQRESETNGWAARWSSVDVLTEAVQSQDVYVWPFLRKFRDGELRALRCFVAYTSTAGSAEITPFDISPQSANRLPTLDLDQAVRHAFSRIAYIAVSGSALVPKA